MLSHLKSVFTTSAVFTIVVACSTQAQTPVKWTATAGSAVPAGGETSVKLSATIENGWYIYSVTQPSGGPVPTRISVPDSQVFALAGKPTATIAPVTKFDENFGINVEIHSKKAELTVPLKVGKNAKTGANNGTVAVRYQACNASLCLPAKTEKLQVALDVKGGKS